MLAVEVNHGANPFLIAWKGQPAAFTKAFQAQFTAYTQGAYPFMTPLGQDEDPLDSQTMVLTIHIYIFDNRKLQSRSTQSSCNRPTFYG